MTLLLLRHLLLAGTGVGILLLVAFALRPLTRRDAVLRYRLMLAALLAAALLLPLQALTAHLAPRGTPLASVQPLPTPRATPALETSPAIHASAVPAPTNTSTHAALAAPRNFAIPHFPTLTTRSAALLLTIYVAGAALLVTLHALRARAARHLLKDARPVTDPRVLRAWQPLVAHLRNPPALLECPALHAPACRAPLLGRDRTPAVILPTGASTLEPSTLLAALQHELIHLARRDCATALLATALTTLLWFQPLTWLFARLLRADREHSCDALVIRATREPRSYALALLRFCSSTRTAPSLIGFESSQSIRRRITMLAHASQPAPRRHHALILGAGLACLASASTAHAFLTAVASPTLHTVPTTSPTETPVPPFTTKPIQPAQHMITEVLAPISGRADIDVLHRLIKQGVISQDVLPAKDMWAAFKLDNTKDTGVRPANKTVTDQAVVIAAKLANTDRGAENLPDTATVLADQLTLSLPEGSKLRAIFEGANVAVDTRPDNSTHILITSGTVRIVDEYGITRARISPASARDTTTIQLTSTPSPNAITYELSASESSSPIPVRLITNTVETAAPSAKPAHGSSRWLLAAPSNDPSPYHYSIEWTYDLATLAASEGC